MRKIVRLAAVPAILHLFSFGARAQEYIGYTTGNYSGVNSLNYNPAGIVDSRFKVDIVLTGANVYTGNNYVGVDRLAIFNPKYFDDPDFGDKYLLRSTNKKSYAGYVNASIQLPSALITLTKNDAIVFTPLTVLA